MNRHERNAVRGTAHDVSIWDMYLYFCHPQPGDVVVELGAGQGGGTHLFSELVGAAGQVVAVESDPRLFRRLRRTIEVHGLANVTPVRCALVGREGPANDSVVLTERLDDLLERLGVGRIDFLKVNIGGAELDVLAAAHRVLPRVRGIAVSCHDFRAHDGDDTWPRTADAVGDLLCDAGFTVLRRPEDERARIYCCVYGSR